MTAYKPLDSHVLVDGLLLEVIDCDWAKDVLPFEDILVPLQELPDPEPDSATANLTLRQLESRWSDLLLGELQKTPPSVPSNEPISNPDYRGLSASARSRLNVR
ncbi:anaphase-promoting complex subunit 13 [Hyalella azteca]|uniref:Anaphase-promoting complex subunit 13 n=1 Tax=Hyalella azteca TaxID=294128 RepID=A0A8B7N286_HYAAZ|nr:anaphase-promoting complex subunit 13 [Hyalella azteca]